MWAIGIAVVSFLTLGQALFRYGDPLTLAAIGVGFGGAALAFDTIFGAHGVVRRWLLVVALALGAVAGAGIVVEAADMSDASIANDRRCAAIQRDMLSAHPRLAAGADLFRALECGASGDDPRIFVPPTDRERRAGHPLPDGGYPPPP